MGGKRKAGALPEEILQVPAAASRSGAPPLAVYFPSGFDPNKHSGECSWATYAHKDKKSQFTVVAATVRHGVLHCRCAEQTQAAATACTARTVKTRSSTCRREPKSGKKTCWWLTSPDPKMNS